MELSTGSDWQHVTSASLGSALATPHTLGSLGEKVQAFICLLSLSLIHTFLYSVPSPMHLPMHQSGIMGKVRLHPPGAQALLCVSLVHT